MPDNFSFLIDGKLAGMERPGSYARLRDDLEYLKLQSIHAIVSLTETPLEKAFIEEFGFRYLHLPVRDFAPPSIEQVERFLTFYKESEQESHPVVVHCAAGLGRTGTMLACVLVYQGMNPEAAIDTVRTHRPHSIETEDQEDVIREYAAFLAKQRERAKLPPDSAKGEGSAASQ